MFSSWLMVSLNVVMVSYFIILILYYRNLNFKEKSKITSMQVTLEEAEILIKKYQIQLQKVLGSVDIINEELEDARNDLKALRSRYSQAKTENDRNKIVMRKLEAKIESLM